MRGDILRDSNLVEWNDGHGKRFTHDLFRFPGKFHPPLVEHILRITKPNAVMDPMAGVGTVAVEAKAAGIPSLSVDIDPVGVFFAKVKTTPINQEVLKSAWQSLRSSLEKHRRSREEIEARRFRDIRHDIMRRDLKRVGGKDLERLIYWFRRYVLVDYARINYVILNGGLSSTTQKTRRFFLACLLSCVRRISKADPSPVSGLEITSQMRKKMDLGYEIDAFGEFERRVTAAMERMEEYASCLEEQGTDVTRTTILRTDCKNLRKVIQATSFSPDLILFSPPYCNAIEYWRRHRLEYLLGGFLGEDEIRDISRKFIGRTVTGGRSMQPDRFGFRPVDGLIQELCKQRRVHKACVLAQYFFEMQMRLSEFYQCLPKGSHCIMVIGDSQTGDLRVPTARTLTWLAEKMGFSHVKTSRYKIRNRSMQFPVKPHPKIAEESIVVLQRKK